MCSIKGQTLVRETSKDGFSVHFALKVLFGSNFLHFSTKILIAGCFLKLGVHLL